MDRLSFAEMLDGSKLSVSEQPAFEQVGAELASAGFELPSLSNVLRYLKEERTSLRHTREAATLSEAELCAVADKVLEVQRDVDRTKKLIQFMGAKFGREHPLAMNGAL